MHREVINNLGRKVFVNKNKKTIYATTFGCLFVKMGIVRAVHLQKYSTIYFNSLSSFSIKKEIMDPAGNLLYRKSTNNLIKVISEKTEFSKEVGLVP